MRGNQETSRPDLKPQMTAQDSHAICSYITAPTERGSRIQKTRKSFKSRPESDPESVSYQSSKARLKSSLLWRNKENWRLQPGTRNVFSHPDAKTQPVKRHPGKQTTAKFVKPNEELEGGEREKCDVGESIP